MNFNRAVKFALTAVAVLWGVHALNLFLPIDLRYFGIQPRRMDGLVGIVAAPFLHGDLNHLIANSSALLVLLAVALAYNRKMAFAALATIIVLGGLMVWIFGSASAIHIGASGVVFGLIGYLLFVGIFRREWIALIVSAVVLLLYGGALLSLLRIIPGVSWSSHFFGFMAGVAAAWSTRGKK